MKKSFNLIAILLLMTSIFGCKKEAFNGLSDIRPAIPVTVTNAIDFRPEPTVAASASGGGQIQITLSIPSSSGRTIKEITKVAIGTSYTQIQSTGTTGFYNTAPIPVNATSYTFTSSFAEFTSKGGGAIPAVNNELPKRFYFLITLDDGTVIIPESVRVLVAN